MDGIVPEYADATHRYLGAKEATAYLGQIDPSTMMAHSAVRPAWVGLVDFRHPAPERARRRALLSLVPDPAGRDRERLGAMV
jgi:hypothetical protein